MKNCSSDVNSMFVNTLVKKRNKKNQSQFSRKITPTDKVGAMKVSLKITTQQGQCIFHEIFTKDNTEPN